MFGTSHAALCSPPIHDAVCLGCGCLCDDIAVHVADGRIVQAERACHIGERWFHADRPTDVPACMVDGGPTDVETGCARAAAILSAAKTPIVFGLAGATCEAQRVAVAIADRVGACIDSAGGQNLGAIEAARSIGMVTATLGEVRHRADLVIFWGVDPATTHPRHFERYSLHCAGEFVPSGRRGRTCYVVDCDETATSNAADIFLRIAPHNHLAALQTLRAVVAGEDVDDQQVLNDTGVALNEWRAAAEHMKSARYGALFFDAGPLADQGEPSASALQLLLQLVRDLNRHTRFVALPLGAAGNEVGAEQVLTWQTGHPAAISFADGSPKYDRHFSAAAILAEGKADAALIVACDEMLDPFATLPAPAQARLATVPCIVLHSAEIRPTTTAAVSFCVATTGIHTRGTVFRSDGVPLPLRPALTSPHPTAETVLRSIDEKLSRMMEGQR